MTIPKNSLTFHDSSKAFCDFISGLSETAFKIDAQAFLTLADPGIHFGF